MYGQADAPNLPPQLGHRPDRGHPVWAAPDDDRAPQQGLGLDLTVDHVDGALGFLVVWHEGQGSEQVFPSTDATPGRGLTSSRMPKEHQSDLGWVGSQEAADYLGITLRTLYRLIDEGGLPA